MGGPASTAPRQARTARVLRTALVLGCIVGVVRSSSGATMRDGGPASRPVHQGDPVAHGTTRAAAATPNLLVIVIDAQRADHLSSHGYGRPTTPRLDALATRGTRFTTAIAASNRTGTSMASLWTGLLPSRHGVFRTGDVLADDVTTLAELLRARGYRTGAWCPNPSLDRSFGHAQGWDSYDDDILIDAADGVPTWQRWETATTINERALRWIAQDPQTPFLAWLHYRDVHGPYVPPPPYDRMFPRQGSRLLTDAEVAARPPYLTLPGDGNDLLHYVSQYDGDVRYTDERIGELLEALERRGVLERTVVVVTADHGEAFLDHGQWNHDASLYDEEVHVPLLVVRPGDRARVVERVVSGIDLFPTLLALAGAPLPASDGESLLPLLDGDDARYRRRFAYAESRAPWRAVQRTARDARWKVIVNDSLVARFFGSPLELYDLAADPDERRSLAATEPDRAAAMAGDVRAAVTRPLASRAAAPGEAAAGASDAAARRPAPTSAAGAAARRAPGGELERRLEALGYVD
jgi:arylsulfatase A-like enzyme